MMKLRGKGFYITTVIGATIFSCELEGLAHTARFILQVCLVSNVLCTCLCELPDETRDKRASWNKGYWAQFCFLEIEGLAHRILLIVVGLFVCCLLFIVCC